jgi:hypothetical protein
MGKIAWVEVVYVVETDEPPNLRTYGLDTIRQHARPERVEELLEDLEKICEDVHAATSGPLRVVK